MVVNLAVSGGHSKEISLLQNAIIDRNEIRIFPFAYELSSEDSICFKIQIRPLGSDNITVLDPTSMWLNMEEDEWFTQRIRPEETLEQMKERYQIKMAKKKVEMEALKQLQAGNDEEDDNEMCVTNSSYVQSEVRGSFDTDLVNRYDFAEEGDQFEAQTVKAG